MNMIEFDSFVNRVAQAAPMAPEPFVIQKVRDCAIELCERGRLWRVYDTFTVRSDDRLIDICDAEQAEIYELRSARFNDGPPLEVMTSYELDEKHPNWRVDEVDTGTPSIITTLTSNTVSLWLQAAGTLSAELILKPSIDCFQLPEFLGREYEKTIAHGATALVLKTPNRDFTNPQLAAAEFQLWERELDRLSTGRGPKGKTRAPIRTKSRFV